MPPSLVHISSIIIIIIITAKTKRRVTRSHDSGSDLLAGSHKVSKHGERQGRAGQGRAGQGMEGKELHSPQWHTMNLARESSYTLAERGKARGEEGSRTQGRAG